MPSISPAERARRLGPRVAVSTFSAYRELPAVRFPVENAAGEVEEIALTEGGPVAITDFPGIVRARFGESAVEICQIQVPDVSGAAIADLADALHAADVDVLAIPIDIGNIANPDPARRSAYLEQIREWIGIATRLGASFVRVNAGAPTGSPHSSRDALVDSLRLLADDADAADIGLLVENHGGDSADPDWMIGLVEEIGADRLGIILDTGNLEPMLSASHARFAGERLDEAAIDFEPVYAKIAKLAPHATLVHAKAHDVNDDGTFGPVDLRRALGIIRDAGYDGPVTVEYEGDAGDTWENTRRTVALVREVFGR